MKLLHPRPFVCRDCQLVPLDEPCSRRGDPCHQCEVCLRLRRPCHVHHYGLVRSHDRDSEGRRERPVRDLWCIHCQGLSPDAQCRRDCGSCSDCRGVGPGRSHCKRHCEICSQPGRMFCPIHYTPDPDEASHRYVATLKLGKPSGTSRIASASNLILVTAAWSSLSPDIARFLIDRGMPAPVKRLTETQLLDVKYPRHFAYGNVPSFTEAVSAPAALILLIGVWGGGKHEALPGVVTEMVRLRASKITLLLNEPTTPWNSKHGTYSLHLDRILTERGKRLTLKETS